MRHYLKIEQVYLDNLLSGKKKSEIRLNDRDYQVGDTLYFKYKYEFEITHIHSGLGLQNGYVVLSVEDLKRI